MKIILSLAFLIIMVGDCDEATQPVDYNIGFLDDPFDNDLYAYAPPPSVPVIPGDLFIGANEDTKSTRTPTVTESLQKLLLLPPTEERVIYLNNSILDELMEMNLTEFLDNSTSNTALNKFVTELNSDCKCGG